MKIAKIKIIVQNIKAEWICPECKTLNDEWLYDVPQRVAIHCCHCGGHFRGKFQ